MNIFIANSRQYTPAFGKSGQTCSGDEDGSGLAVLERSGWHGDDPNMACQGPALA